MIHNYSVNTAAEWRSLEMSLNLVLISFQYSPFTPFEGLPNKVLLQIYSFLGCRDHLKLTLSDKRINRIIIMFRETSRRFISLEIQYVMLMNHISSWCWWARWTNLSQKSPSVAASLRSLDFVRLFKFFCQSCSSVNCTWCQLCPKLQIISKPYLSST